MSTASLPTYTAPPDLTRTPSYAPEPRAEERRLAHAIVYQYNGRRRSADFIKQSKTGGMSLRLSDQIEGTNIPTYGMRSPIEGSIELAKTEGLAFVAIKVEGIMKLKEIAEGGTNTSVLCNELVTLWRRGVDPSPCPNYLSFSVSLPGEYVDERGAYPLPPSYEAHLTGLPGFTANVDYEVTAIASRIKLPKVGALTGIGQTTVSTPFLFRPRTCPSSPLPSPMVETNSILGLLEVPSWRAYESRIVARTAGAKPILCRFYVPRSHVFCFSEPIPFHITFCSSAMTLATLLPFLPTVNQAPGKSSTRIQLLRQTCVDVRDEYRLEGINTELWRVINIGEGTMRRSVDGPRWLAFSGEIRINPDIKVGGFKASGLWVRDCIVFSLTPPDTLKGPIGDARVVVPIRLVTDPYSNDAHAPRVSPPGSDELLDNAASLPYE
ncbi:hypothetical protein K488DRAFT_60566 [Vararia minispora EC-137]|uniref:Uncharacterized protein n=1 Tax=Vararia minispora EC-137 TaxID=1314806 RepID=A0ACB8Q7I0_9AGAM|nr:hypothetical protein K488DRAFT_60566 [Vararia minispora EC-137]